MSVSRRLRFEVLRRDGHTCRYCGAKAPEATITIDHVVPVSLGGRDVAENLVAACVDCNSGKSSSQPDAEFVRQVEDDAFQWKATVKDALRREVKEYPAVLAALAEFDATWESYHYGDDASDTVPRESDWRQSFKAWLNVLTQGELEDPEYVDLALQVVLGLIPVAMARKGVESRWRYFCGCVWTKVREMQGKLDVPEPPEPVLPVEHRLRFDGDEYSCSCGRLGCRETTRQSDPTVSHFIVEDDGLTWCDTCDDPYCSHLYAYRLRHGLT